MLSELARMIVKKVIENELLSYGEAWEYFELVVDNNEMFSLRCERGKDYSVFPSLTLYDDYRNRIVKHHSMRSEIYGGMKVRQLIAHTSDGDIVKVYPADWEGFVIPRSNRYVSTDGRKEYKVSDLWFLDAHSLEVNSYF